MNTFGEYMYSLLHTPLKQVKKSLNTFYILFKVIGKLFDQTKQNILLVRESSMVATANELMLHEHAKEREMVAIEGESVETFRKRLSMKAIIAQKAGTAGGVLLAVASLGYEKSYIEPLYLSDSERWAEFIIYLRGKQVSEINDIALINSEVMKVKEASSLPSYGVDTGNTIQYISKIDAGMAQIPLCGTRLCGMHPTGRSVGIWKP